MAAGSQEGWRWNVLKHPRPTNASITVTEPSPEQREERQRRIDEGAEVVPFGFSRVLPREPKGEREPLLWEGDGA